jgi:hypothetical protein
MKKKKKQAETQFTIIGAIATSLYIACFGVVVFGGFLVTELIWQ